MHSRKIVLCSISVIALTIYLLACNNKFVGFFFECFQSDRVPKAFRYDKFIYGDLYGLSYLRDFKEPVNGYYSDNRTPANAVRKVNLWFIGDSYLGYIFYDKPEKADSFLSNATFKHFAWYWRSREPEIVSFERDKKNILVIEQNERFIRTSFSIKVNADIFLKYYKTSGSQEKTTIKRKIAEAIEYRIIPGGIEQVFEAILFGYDFLSPIKQTKAYLNNKFFGRTLSSEVYLSKNKRNLFVGGTVKKNSNQCSFDSIPQQEVNEIVNNINRIANHYKKMGFDEVIFSITPSAVSIIGEEGRHYNNLIPRIQTHPALEIPVIDVYSSLKLYKNPSELYWPNDSHWNSKGFKLWVDELNKKTSGS